MKRIMKSFVSLLLVICILSSLNITVTAENMNDQGNSSFAYDNVTLYVADCIMNGIIGKNGKSDCIPMMSLALMHKYTYKNISEALIGDDLLVFTSGFWKNLRNILSGDLVKTANWQKDLYVLIIMDYLNFSVKSDEYSDNFEKKTFEITEDIVKNVFDYANTEYLDNVDKLIKEQSLSDAIEFSNKYGFINEINQYYTLVGDIEKISDSAAEYYKNLSKAIAIKETDEKRIKFLEQMKKAGNDNEYFVDAVDEVIKVYKSSYANIAFSESKQVMVEFGVKECFSKLKDLNSDLKIIIDGLNIYSAGLDWLFNSDDVSDNNFKLMLLYTIGSYASNSVRSLRDSYEADRSEENASALIEGYMEYLEYERYATDNTYGFVSSILFDGVANKIKNIFSNKNKTTYDDFKGYLNYDESFAKNLEELVNACYKIYFNITGFDNDIFDDNDNSYDDNSENVSTKIPTDALECNGHYYYIYSDVCDTWEDAESYCESLGGYLSIIENNDENAYLYDYMKKQGYDNAYFGLTDSKNEGEWLTVNGEQPKFTNWSDGEPNNEGGNENYAMFYHKSSAYKWNDGNFGNGTNGDDKTFICEWDEKSVEKNQNNTSSERDIVLVLDTSGSMDGTPIDETKKAANKFVDTILENDANIGIVSYSDDADVKSNFTKSKNSLENVINNLNTSGSTNMEAGLRSANNMLEQSQAKKKIIVLMSDGLPNEGLEGDELVSYANELKEKGVYIYTLGFFESVDDKTAPQSLLERIANDGCHYEVSDADSLVFFFGDIADQINGQKYIYVRIACPVEVSVKYNGETLNSSDNELNTRTSFGTLTFEETNSSVSTSEYDSQNELSDEKSDKVKILRLKEGDDYDVKIEGTGRGRMDYSIGFMDENGEYTDFRKFKNIRITGSTEIDTVANVSDHTVLNVDEDGDGKYDVVYRAVANSNGEIVDYSYIWYIVISGVSVIALIIIVFVVIRKKRKFKNKIN